MDKAGLGTWWGMDKQGQWVWSGMVGDGRIEYMGMVHGVMPWRYGGDGQTPHISR
ncbi:hypothetical protein GCM10017783_25080 [Deinococcus piscis]|uniref:Uncharacterized protein n=1 Tax=Deinococcus piscis TaxID=394230 RepID=A0ABQ3KEU7_9DEIO|nr:hypothetical protein GCM10017783_25080 [Deinococcus piscis]